MRIIEGKLEKARFLSRPNRFVVQCEREGEEITAYLPNPGRLWELLFPGTVLIIKKNGSIAKIPYTVMAVEKDGVPILLHTHLTNTVVEMLLKKRLIPGLEAASVVRREVTFGESRFDFLLEREGREFVLEVKNCTLFGGGLAMFPDAVTERGSRHLVGLAALAKKGIPAGVLFAVQWPHAKYFMPEYHTDYGFAKTLLACRDDLFVKAVGLTWREDFSLAPKVNDLIIPWEIIEEKTRDSGCYIVILQLDKDAQYAIGELGIIPFRKGYYLYVGSAKRGLSKRIERHQRLRKNHFWHIDYLRGQTSFRKGLAIRTGDDIECALARDVGAIADRSVPGFGCSDCSCKSHLFGMDADPLTSRPFVDMLFRYRIGKVEEELENRGY